MQSGGWSAYKVTGWSLRVKAAGDMVVLCLSANACLNLQPGSLQKRFADYSGIHLTFIKRTGQLCDGPRWYKSDCSTGSSPHLHVGSSLFWETHFSAYKRKEQNSFLFYIGRFLLYVVSCIPFFSFVRSLANIMIAVTASAYVSSVAQLCLTLCNPMDYSTPAFPVHHQLLELPQTHVH